MTRQVFLAVNTDGDYAYALGNDEWLTRHFDKWLDSHVIDEDRAQTERLIRRLLTDHPDLIATKSWSEMRELAERNYR